MTSPALAYPRNTRAVDQNGHLTPEFARFIEEMAFRLKKIQAAAEEYSALDTGSATTTQIATALNTLVATILET